MGNQQTDDKNTDERNLAMTKERSLPVSQKILMSNVFPRIEAADHCYKKFKQVNARPAIVGEVIVSITAVGKETENTAEKDDFVVMNLTEAREMYIVDGQTFNSKYAEPVPVDNQWARYEPRGEVLAIEITAELTTKLGVSDEFSIVAPWDSSQRVREGDYFVTPLPEKGEIYGIADKEFHETYELKEPE